MSRVAHAFAVVTVPSLDVRTEPSHRAELASQLLLGETVRFEGGSRDGWQRVRSETDGYRGWARTWGLVTTSAAGARRWAERATVRVSDLFVASTATASGGIGVGPLPWGARLIPGGTRRGRRQLEWPDGRRGWVPASAVEDAGSGPRSLLRRGFELLGVPYLWGGRTPAGLDCSALVQLLLAEQGVAVPRDARDQARACPRLPRGAEPQPGDLACFARPGERVSHVGLCTGGSTFLHARGWVRLGSLDPSSPLYDSELSGQFRCWVRPPRP